MQIRKTGIWKLFSSVTLAIWLLASIAVTSVVGTLILQNDEPAGYIAKYGHTAYKIFLNMGLTNVYSAWWFLLLLAILSANLIVCLLNSFFSKKIRSIGTIIAHASVLVIFAGALIGMFCGVKGRVTIVEGKSVDSFRSRDKVIKLGFAVRLDDFVYEENIDPEEKVIVYSNDGNILTEVSVGEDAGVTIPRSGYTIKVLRYVPDFVMNTATKEVTTRSGDPRNPAVEIELTNGDEIKKFWVFAAYPDVHNKIGEDLKLKYVWAPRRPKDFISQVTIVKDGKDVLNGDIKVNSPMRFDGYTFFQSSYDKEGHTWTGLQVVKDPGVPVVYLGFLLLIAGLVVRFYINPVIKKKGNR